MILAGYKPISWVIRDCLIQCDTFDCAKQLLSDTTIVAPGYITLAGTKGYEGVVISRDRMKPAHVD